MFDTAYLTVRTDLPLTAERLDVKKQQLDYHNNYFRFDGGEKQIICDFPITYKIKSGHHTVVITSGNGDSWELSANIGYNKEWVVEVSVSGRDICDVRHGERTASSGTGFLAKRLR